VFGLAFSTILTLIVTPSALMVFTRERPEDGMISRIKRMFRRKPAKVKARASDGEHGGELPVPAE
jgi:multidrug efflux pump